ncbi:hypothetical protein ACHAXH_004677 [Discostella pseudostelligera]
MALASHLRPNPRVDALNALESCLFEASKTIAETRSNNVPSSDFSSTQSSFLRDIVSSSAYTCLSGLVPAISGAPQCYRDVDPRDISPLLTKGFICMPHVNNPTQRRLQKSRVVYVALDHVTLSLTCVLKFVPEVVQCLLETFPLLLVAPFVGSHGLAEILNGLIRLCMLFHQRRYLDG